MGTLGKIQSLLAAIDFNTSGNAVYSYPIQLMTILGKPAWAGRVASMATNSAEIPA